MLMYFAHEFEDELDAHLQRWHECSTARTAAPVTTIEQVELCPSVVIMVVIDCSNKQGLQQDDGNQQTNFYSCHRTTVRQEVRILELRFLSPTYGQP